MTGKPYPIKVWLEGAPAISSGLSGDAGSWAEATKHVDFIVHMFNYPTSFSTCMRICFFAYNRMARNRLPSLGLLIRFGLAKLSCILRKHAMKQLFGQKFSSAAVELGPEVCRKSFDPEFMGADLRNGIQWMKFWI